MVGVGETVDGWKGPEPINLMRLGAGLSLDSPHSFPVSGYRVKFDPRPVQGSYGRAYQPQPETQNEQAQQDEILAETGNSFKEILAADLDGNSLKDPEMDEVCPNVCTSHVQGPSRFKRLESGPDMDERPTSADMLESFHPQPSILTPQFSTLNLQLSTHNPQPFLNCRRT